jgi:hypothetical protein
MELLERHRGHFYNWYDTRSLAPLLPRYVSSVDSGNLSAHLLTLKAGLQTLPDEPVTGLRALRGLRDTMLVLAELLEGEPPADLAACRDALAAALVAPPAMLEDARSRLEQLAALAEAGARMLGEAPGTEDPTARWAGRLAAQAREAVRALEWIPREDPTAPIPTLRALAGRDGADSEVARAARERIGALERLAERAGEFSDVEYEFLYDRSRHLMAIGYNVGERRRDPSYYDLLASEARLTSFIGIAEGRLPQENWFALGRLLTSAGGAPILMSWSSW